MPLTVGGGVRELQDIRDLLNAGADKVSINTAAVQNPDFVRAACERFGRQCIVVAIDAKRVAAPTPRWEVFTHGGRTPTGLDAVEWARRMEAAGAGEILLTSMDRDGTKDGLRHRAHARDRRRRARAGDRLGRRRHARAHLRGPHRRRRHRRAGGVDLPLPRVHRAAVQGVPRATRGVAIR